MSRSTFPCRSPSPSCLRNEREGRWQPTPPPLGPRPQTPTLIPASLRPRRRNGQNGHARSGPEPRLLVDSLIMPPCPDVPSPYTCSVEPVCCKGNTKASYSEGSPDSATQQRGG